MYTYILNGIQLQWPEIEIENGHWKCARIISEIRWIQWNNKKEETQNMYGQWTRKYRHKEPCRNIPKERKCHTHTHTKWENGTANIQINNCFDLHVCHLLLCVCVIMSSDFFFFLHKSSWTECKVKIIAHKKMLRRFFSRAMYETVFSVNTKIRNWPPCLYWAFSYRFFDINDLILNCLLKLLKRKFQSKRVFKTNRLYVFCLYVLSFVVVLCAAASIHFRHNFQLELLIMSVKHSYIS